jgi:hypothetical protein
METSAVSKRSEERLNAALAFLVGYSDEARRLAPMGEGDQYAGMLWRPHAPDYCWESTYGDFTPATLMAGVRRGLIERPERYDHAYRITPAGREAHMKATHETCECGKPTHAQEAACLHCGAHKSWATDPLWLASVGGGE